MQRYLLASFWLLNYLLNDNITMFFEIKFNQFDSSTRPGCLLERGRRVWPSHLEYVLHGVPELGEGEELGRAVLDGRHGYPLVRTRRGPALARLATRKLLPVDKYSEMVIYYCIM